MILILLCWGWTIFSNYCEDYDLYIVLSILLGFAHFITILIELIFYGDKEVTYHDYDGFA